MLFDYDPTRAGAKANANANALEPCACLRHVFTELPKAQSLAEVEALLPTRLDSDTLTPHSSLAPRPPHQSTSTAPFPGRLRFEGSTVTLIRPSRDLHALGRCPHVVAIRIGTSERTGQPGFTGFETTRR